MSVSEPADGPVADIRILGPLRVTVQGQNVTPRSARAGRLLALLAAHANTTVPIARIIDVLWDEPPVSARQQVHNVVGALRRALSGPVEVLTDATGYRLAVDERAVDALRFAADVGEAERLAALHRPAEAADLLERGLAQWQGEAFSGLACAVLDSEAALLDEQRLAGTERLAELRILLGDAEPTVGHLQQLVLEYPLRESLRAVLMRVLCRVGRQAEAIMVFEDGRRLLDEELGILPGPLLRAAHRESLLGEPGAERADSPAPRKAAPQPDFGLGGGNTFLPRDIGEFTGRRTEIEQLLSHARNSGARALVISAINGMGGVGKSALAVHVAHLLAERYPDGRFFIDLRGFSQGTPALPPIDALGLLLRDSGLAPEALPADLEGRAALWRSRLAGRKVLVLLDNALNAEQVRPLLPGTAGALVLISSRHRMTAMEGAMSLPLDVMPLADAVDLFSRVAGRERAEAEPAAVAEAVELCSRLPLAIQAAAARLRDRPVWPVAHLVEQLRDRQGRRLILAAGDRGAIDVLSWSYDHLTARQQRIFRLLGVSRGPDIDVDAAAALCGLSRWDAMAGLEELCDVHLLDQPSPGRYRLHDLVRDCALGIGAQEGDGAEHTAAADRLLDYWLSCVTSWHAEIVPPPLRFAPLIRNEPLNVPGAGDRDEALALFRQEYRNVTAAIELAVEHDRSAHVWLLTCSLQPYFSMLHFGGEATRLIDQALVSARAADSVLGESACLMARAQAHRAHGTFAQGRECAARAITLSRARQDPAREITHHILLGAIYVDDNLFDEALGCYTTAQDLCRVTGNDYSAANISNNIGVIHREHGRLDAALEQFHLALSQFQGDVHRLERALTLANTAELECLTGDYPAAAGHLDEALGLAQSSGDVGARAWVLFGLCTVHRLLGDHDLSLTHGRNALEVAREGQMFDVESDTIGALGDTHLAMGDLTAAEQSFDRALDLAEGQDSARYRARAHEGHAHVAAARGDRAAAEERWRLALATYPGGVVNAAEARLHLADPAADCWRCRR